MTAIENPFAGSKVGADWAWHKSHGYLGGTDYVVDAGVAVTAACDGTAYREDDGINSLSIHLDDGRRVTVRELQDEAHMPASGSRVTRGQPIGLTGRNNGGEIMWPHIDATDVDGNRVQFEPLITVTTDTDTGTTDPTVEEYEDMGIYTRIANGPSTGQVYYQATPAAPLLALIGAQWSAAAANGNAYADLDAAEVTKLQGRVGVIALDGNGRVIRSDGGLPVVNWP